MAKHCSFIAEKVTLISQNNRSLTSLANLRKALTSCHNVKYPTTPFPRSPLIASNLQVKLFYIHRKADFKDADNLSKPLWDSLNNHVYVDDKQIKYLETLKIDVNTPDLFELDVTKIDTIDMEQLFDFIFNLGGSKDKMLYISIEDYECKNVRF